MNNTEDVFSKKVIDAIAMRASFICSNPDCRSLTLFPSEENHEIVQYFGNAAHITAKAMGGPRYDHSLSSEQRRSIENAIYLCTNCATRIDKNNGLDYSVELLHQWKTNHEQWIRNNLNKSKESPINEINNTTIIAIGEGDITGALIEDHTIFRDSKITAIGKGRGNITGLHVKVTNEDYSSNDTDNQ